MRPGIALDGLAVFCIDNDPRIVDGMRLLLERWGCRVWTFPGASAVEAHRADLAGARHRACRLSPRRRERARRDPQDQDDLRDATRPAILVTADRSTEVRAAAELIDVPVINKPVKPAALRSLITRMRRMTPAAAE